jgi:hypothetical protein
LLAGLLIPGGSQVQHQHGDVVLLRHPSCLAPRAVIAHPQRAGWITPVVLDPAGGRTRPR